MDIPIPIRIAVVAVPLAHDADLETIATVVILVSGPGVGWLLWQRK